MVFIALSKTLLEDSKNEEFIVKSISSSYLNNDVTLILKHDEFFELWGSFTSLLGKE